MKRAAADSSRASCYASWVAQDFFIATLAVLTVAVGSVLLAMVRRRRRRATKPTKPSALPAGPARAGQPRPIDDYALPVSLEQEADDPEERDLGKICPACGSRYGSHFRYCERDNSELAALN